MTDERDPGDMAIASEQALEQRPISFMEDELAAARTAAGAIYVTLPGMCRALGLNTQAQFRRIFRSPVLAKGLRIIPLETRGGVQPVNCLRVDRVALWLAGVETSRIKPGFREKIEAYQDELAPVAMQVFMRALDVQPGVTTATGVISTRFTELAEQIDTLTGVVAFLQEHLDAGLAATGEQIGALSLRLDEVVRLLEALGERHGATEDQIARIDERTQRLTPAHARAIQDTVDHLVRATKRLATPLTYVIIYGRLKHRFRAGSYREIADDQYEAALSYLRDELHRALGGDNPEQGALF